MYIFLCMLIFAGAWYDTVHSHVLTGYINPLLQPIIASPTGIYHDCLTIITFLGNDSVFIITSAFLFLWLFKKRDMRSLWIFLMTVVVVIGLGKLAKHLIYSPRPFPFNEAIDSFPSGHTIRVTLWCGLYLLAYQLKAINIPRFVYYLFIIIPLLVGFSRLGLSKHWFSDVIAAYALTIGALLTTYKIQGKK